jgi:hypothetical protein
VSKELHWVYYLWAKRVATDAVGEQRERGDYNLYNYEASTLLYVGMTRDFPDRIKQHFKNKDWAFAVGEINLWVYPSREEAEKAEKEAISEWQPIFNTMHTEMNAWRDTPQNLKHKETREEFMAEFGEWVPAGEDEFKDRVLELWKEQWLFAEMDIKRLNRELRILTRKATKGGIDYSSIQKMVTVATSNALKAVEPIEYESELMK